MIRISLYQIILGATALFFLLNSLAKFFRGERSQTIFKLLSAIVIWGGILVFSFFPDLTHSLSKNLGLGENLNTLIFIGFVAIFALIFKMLNIIERIEKNISEIIRKEALKSLKSNSSKDEDSLC
jgi:hypothetical protein